MNLEREELYSEILIAFNDNGRKYTENHFNRQDIHTAMLHRFLSCKDLEKVIFSSPSRNMLISSMEELGFRFSRHNYDTNCHAYLDNIMFRLSETDGEYSLEPV